MVTDEMVEKAANAIAEKRGYVWPGTFDAEEIKIGRENMRAALEAALYAAEPVAFVTDEMVERIIPLVRGTEWEKMCKYSTVAAVRSLARSVLEAAFFAASPAPAVAVKALEWKPVVEGGRDVEAVTEFGKYTISIDSSFAGGRHYLWTPDQKEYDDEHHSEHSGKTSAHNAAKADYESRIRSALSAQVQDVAGWQDISTAPRDGTTVLLYAPGWDSPKTGWTYGKDDWQDCPYSHKGSESYLPTHWMPLPLAPAAPAKQEGGHD